MKKTLLAILSLTALTVSAQDNLCWGDGVSIHPLGEFKTWELDGSDIFFTVEQENLNKIIAQPTNTSNVFLFPQDGGKWDTPDNLAIGIQGFYIDFGTSKSVAIVSTTWEGAAAKAFEIYCTDSEPTLAILDTEPTFQASGLGQYTENTAVMPDGTRGRYLVFQPTDATNWGWGVKIRSISVAEPTETILSSIKVSPTFVPLNSETAIVTNVYDQFGLEIKDGVEINVTGDGDVKFEDGKLTIQSGTYAEFSATYGEKTISAKVYAPSVPREIADELIETAILTKGQPTGLNLELGYHSGATKKDLISFDDGNVAQPFENARCIFFNNKETLGAWDATFNPSELGFRSLSLDVFPSTDASCEINFETCKGIDNSYTFKIEAGKWNTIEVSVKEATELGKMSIRFDETNMTDILLSNIFFTPTVDENELELTSIVLSVPFIYTFVGETSTLDYQLLDQFDDKIILDKQPQFSIIGDASLNEDYTQITFNAKGEVTIHAELDDVEAELVVYVVADMDDYVMSNDIKYTMDGNPFTDTTNLTDGGNDPYTTKNTYASITGGWENQGAKEHHFVIEFPVNYNLDMFIIAWWNAYPRDYKVYAGASLSDMTEVSNVEGNTNKELVDRICNLQDVKYIEIVTTYNATGYGLEIAELKAYGKAVPVAPKAPEFNQEENHDSRYIVLRTDAAHELYYKVYIQSGANTVSKYDIQLYAIDGNYTNAEEEDSDVVTVTSNDNQKVYTFDTSKLISKADPSKSSIDQLGDNDTLVLSAYAHDPVTDLYSDEGKVGVVKSGTTTGIENVIVGNNNETVEYYNLQGVRVVNPVAGQIVIRRQGNQVTKELVK